MEQLLPCAFLDKQGVADSQILGRVQLLNLRLKNAHLKTYDFIYYQLWVGSW